MPPKIPLVNLEAQYEPIRDELLDALTRCLPVVEDAAQAIGASTRDGRQAGSLGTVAAFSFYPSKNEIVEDQPPDHRSFDEAPTPSATIVFTRGEDSFDRGARGALDAIAQWLETRPEYSAEVRGDRGPLEDPELPERRAHAVMQAILDRGIAETRVSVSEDAAETGFEVTVIASTP